MKDCKALEIQRTRRILLIGCATALAVAVTVGQPQAAHARHVTPPEVPARLVPTGATAFLVGHAVGTQNYICLPSGAGFKFVLFTPQATLFGDNEKQVITHYFSPNPDEDGTPIRATWQDSHDTSTVWASATQMATTATDPKFVKEGAVAWLLLKVVGAQSGPIGSNKLGPTTFIQRVNTSGGLAPPTGCDSLADVGHEAFQPYTADYFFYTGGESDANDGN
jgi:hypothetical protein